MAFSVLVAVPSTPRHTAFHMRLKSSVPAANDTLRAAPSTIELTFSEQPEVTVTRLTLVDPASRSVAVAKPIVAATDPMTITASVDGALKPGRYRIDWTSMSKDGHAVRGNIGLTIVAEAK